MQKKISELNMLSFEEECILKNQFNNTSADYPRDKCVHQLFEEQVLKTPEKTALIACDKTLTYDELNKLSNRIANSLIEKGVKANDIVAFALPRTSFLIAVMFGILKVGSAYMPIDPNYPQDRIDFMLEDSSAKFFITESNLNEFISDNEEKPNAKVSSDNYCYCIYTSGSTGKPKGALLYHKNIVNLVKKLDLYSNIDEIKIFGFLTTITFDVATQEILTALLNGFTGVLFPERRETHVNEIINLIQANNIDIIYATPSYFDTITSVETAAKKLLSLLKTVVLAGEQFYLNDIVEKLSKSCNVVFENQYGPAETHVVTSAHIYVNKTKKICELNILSKKEKNTLLYDFNNTSADYPRDKCVHQLFEEQVLKTPEKTALIACDKTLTYDELNKLSNRIANSLIEKGIKANDIVAFALPRTSFLIAVMFGILKAGSAYMPIDPNYPQDRIDFMLNDSNAKFFINESNLIEFITDDEDNPNVEITSDNYCYCIYTSGSTGVPKATVIKHYSLVNYCFRNYANEIINVINDLNCQNIICINNVCFDAFVDETFLFLLDGKTVILANEKQISNSDYFEDLVRTHNIDVISTTPSKFKVLVKSPVPFKLVVQGGEELTIEHINYINKYSNSVIFNTYGPTETTVGCTCACSDCKLNEAKKITELAILSEKEKNTLLFDFNDTKADYPRDKCVHQLFEEQVLKTPDKTAVIACDKTLSYDELNKLSNRIANSLIEKGVKANDIVAIALPRTSFLIAAILGILKSGAAYMPIDPNYPQDRIDYMIQDSGSKLFITENNLKEFISTNESNSSKYVAAENFYCVIYTSGSTGRPKGCILTHKGIANFCLNNNVVNYAEKNNINLIGASVNNVTFDYFIAENIVLLLRGHTTLLCDDNSCINSALFANLCKKYNVNIMQTTPTKYRILAEPFPEILKKMEIIVTSGEPLTDELYCFMVENSNAKIFNPLGPSECSVWDLGGDMHWEGYSR